METMEACVSTFKDLSDMLKSSDVKDELTDLPLAVENLNEAHPHRHILEHSSERPLAGALP